MHQNIIDFLEATKQEQLNLLESLVLQTSHTLNKQGVDKVGEIIKKSLSGCDLNLKTHPVSERGDNLVFKSTACTGNSQRILLVGHMDTVFPENSSFNYYQEDSSRCYGPGIIDMKGGLVVAIYLIKALHHQGLLDKIPITFICNSDEEMGSLYSRELIEKEAKKSFCGFVFECGGLNNEVVTGRKGKLGFNLEVSGKAGHAAFAGQTNKASAILELAHKTIAMEQLNDPAKELVVNVGTTKGGAAPNIVAERAEAAIDIRFITQADGISCQEQMEKIAQQSFIKGTSGTLRPTTQRYPMEQTEKNNNLFTILQEQAKLLGQKEIQQELRSGVSDANTLAACNIGVVDGLGPIGDLDHSEDEYMIKDSLLERCKLATIGLHEIWLSQKKRV